MKTKRRSRWSRILAIVLAMTMVLCDQSVLYASDSMADPVAEEVVTEPIAEEPAPQAAEAPAAEVAEPQPAAETPATEGEVWIPNSGSKYHKSSDCSNMKNPKQVTLDQAIIMGYTPCKKCY